MARNFVIDYAAKGGPDLIDVKTGLSVGAETPQEKTNRELTNLKNWSNNPKTYKPIQPPLPFKPDEIKPNKKVLPKDKRKFRYESWANNKVERITKPAAAAKEEFTIKDWKNETPKYRKWLADKMVESTQKIFWNKTKGTWNDSLGETVPPEAAVKEQQELSKLHTKIFPPDVEEKYEQERIKGRKFTTGKERDHFKYLSKYGELLPPTKEEIEKTKGRDKDMEILISSSKGDPEQMAQWRRLFTDEAKRGREVEPKFRHLINDWELGEGAKEKYGLAEKKKPAVVDTGFIDEETFTNIGPSRSTLQLQQAEENLKNMLARSAIEKIKDHYSGVNQLAFRRSLNDGGASNDKPPTLEDYLKLGITLANLTQAERDVVQEMLDKTLNRK
tara:strand:+ start:3354 stop:4517 length:1164 start_codon:yes stop_codon:yes gene_type:complete